MLNFLIRLLVNALALVGVAYFLPGVHIASFWSAVIAALILGIVNAVLRPILFVLTLPAVIITLGLFTFVINAILFYLVAHLASASRSTVSVRRSGARSCSRSFRSCFRVS